MDGKPPFFPKARLYSPSSSIGLSTRLFALILVLVGCTILFDRSRASSSLSLRDLPALSLEGKQRILVVAPHPDDETLGAGGLIQAARLEGKQVRVVILTNGDAQRFAPIALSRSIRPRIRDYVSLGQRRQVEARAALELLGLSESDSYFLGYPDHSLRDLWLGDWKMSCPLRSRYTHATQSPYSLTYNSKASYCGSDLLVDLESILAAEQPDLLIIPHPDDGHPDHWAASNFIRLALAEYEQANPNYRPSLWGYLVHYGYFPQPRGLRLNAVLLPPAPLSGASEQWARFDLAQTLEQTKLAALQRYATQIRLLGSFLPSFARRNEVFSSLALVDLPPVGFNNLALHETDPQEIPLSEPADESMRRLLVGGADLVGWKILRLGNSLFLTADLRGRLLPGLQYRILVKTPAGETRIYTLKDSDVSRNASSYTAQVDLAALSDPPVLGVSAEVRQGTTLDQTGWSFLVLHDSVLDFIPTQ